MFKKTLILLILLSLFNCGFQVIYKEDGEQKSQHFSYEQELAAIRIKKDRTKLEQDLKNNLYDLLNPESIKTEPKYFLILKTDKSTTSTFTNSTGSSGRNKIYINVGYELIDLATAEIIGFGNTSVNDNYDVALNRFGTYTADEYTRLNLTKVAAQNIRNSLVNDLTEMKKKRDKEVQEKAEEELPQPALTKQTLKKKKSVR